MKESFKFLFMILAAVFLLWACEGPMGPSGADGTDGADGADANETCKLCHNSSVVDAVAVQYEYSLHSRGEAYEEGTRNNCAPCHSHQGFLYVVKNNTPATITPNTGDPSRYTNNYTAGSAALALPGPISCFTCHSSLHKDYEATEFLPLSTTAPVAMTMWGGAKTINFSRQSSNLCAKCHQPRPLTAGTGQLIDYSRLVSEPYAVYNMSQLSYRTGVHYGTHSAMFSGTGGIEFGTGYENSGHTAGASCVDCHMATPSGMAGGHSFSAKGNYNGCNTADCHSGMSASSALLASAREDIETLLGELADLINSAGNGNDIFQTDPADGENHGYLDIYDSDSNPTGYWRNPANGTPSFPVLTNAQMGAIINFQLVVRDGSMGVHNYPYIKKLLENSIAAL